MARFKLYVFIALIITGMSCERENYSISSDIKLEFSPDTVSFDTIFTKYGSVTKKLKVKNASDHSVILSDVFLAEGNNSPFRLNINGLDQDRDQNVVIAKGDSIYIFVEVTIDPSGKDNPIIVKDSIIFNMDGYTKDVDLIAFGQDFHLFDGEVLETQRWQNDKPYLIYNSIVVDSDAILTIDPGCRIYFHRGASLFVEGTINVNGTFDEPVFFLGDRLESEYDNIPGQWGDWKILSNQNKYIYGGIHFLKGSKDNIIDYAVIKNANKGIQIDSLGNSNNPVLEITNSRIENMTLNCIDARTTKLKAGNCVFANSGSYTVALRYGGEYEFYHCTVANYYRGSIRKEQALILNNYYANSERIYSYDLSKVYWANSIIYGEMDEEIFFDKAGDKDFKYQFKNCLLKTNISFAQDSRFKNSIFNKDPLFKHRDEHNFFLDSSSPARDVGDAKVANQYKYDLNNVSRLEDDGPDLGALEWYPTLEK